MNNTDKILIGHTTNGKEFYINLKEKRTILIVDKNKTGQILFFKKLITELSKTPNKNLIQFLMIEDNHNYDNMDSDIRFYLPIADNREKIDDLLDYLKDTKESRFKLIRESGVYNVEDYNNKECFKLASIYLFIDELAIIQKYDKLEMLMSLIKNSTACGIYIIVATSNVSNKNVLCGKVKANFYNRICFNVDSKEESKLVLDESGAETLNRNNNEVIINEIIKSTIVSLDF